MRSAKIASLLEVEKRTAWGKFHLLVWNEAHEGSVNRVKYGTYPLPAQPTKPATGKMRATLRRGAVNRPMQYDESHRIINHGIRSESP